MTIWVTADPHLSHGRVIDYCNRPFSTVSEMDVALLDGLAQSVRKGDKIYILGDLLFGNRDAHLRLLKLLPGEKFLVFGNHDHRHRSAFIKSGVFAWCKDLAEIKIDGQRIVMCHYPMDSWNASYRGSWHLHGHSHGNLPARGRRMDVGVDCNGYLPVSLDTIKYVMKSRDVALSDLQGDP
jgi:calcineurin-like phosphoesterase family protein